MSRRPVHICPCGNRIPHGVRCRCQRQQDRQRNARHDRRRGTAHRRLYTYEWRKARADFLRAHPICAMPDCGQPATTVDHIIPHRGDDVVFWNRANWQPLCTHCHNSVKQRQERNR